jgi:hypothetical protein
LQDLNKNPSSFNDAATTATTELQSAQKCGSNFYTNCHKMALSKGQIQSQSINKVPTRFDVYIKGNRNDFFATRDADIAIVTGFGMDLLVIYY